MSRTGPTERPDTLELYRVGTRKGDENNLEISSFEETR